MKDSDLQLDRLLRAAAAGGRPLPNEMPFGFATRVVAHWRANWNRDLVDIGRLLRRVVLLSLGVILFASAGVYHDLALPVAADDSSGDEYAIADSAISSAVEP
jgi:Zn-dependent membrane protease YugP